MAAVSFPLGRRCFGAAALRARGLVEPLGVLRKTVGVPRPAGLCASRPFPLAGSARPGLGQAPEGGLRAATPRGPGSSGASRLAFPVLGSSRFFCPRERGPRWIHFQVAVLPPSLTVGVASALTCGDFKFDSPSGRSRGTLYLWEC